MLAEANAKAAAKKAARAAKKAAKCLELQKQIDALGGDDDD